MMRLSHPTEQLAKVSQELFLRLRNAGVEAMPEEIAYVLLSQTDGDHTTAIWNGWEYLAGRRPITELVMEVTAAEEEVEPRMDMAQKCQLLIGFCVLGLVLTIACLLAGEFFNVSN